MGTVYPPPLSQSPIFNPSSFTETVTSVIGSATPPDPTTYLEYPEAQGPETFTNNGGNNTLVVGASQLSIGYDVLTVPKGIAMNGEGFAFNNGAVVSTTTWSGLQTKIAAIQALAPASDSTTLNVNDAITIQNGESPVGTNTIIISASAGDNQLLLSDDAGAVGQVLTSGGPDGSLYWAEAATQSLQQVLNIGNAANNVGDNVSTITLTDIEPSFGIYPNTTTLNPTTISVGEQVENTTNSTTIVKNAMVVAETTSGTQEKIQSRIQFDSISTNYYFTNTNYAGVNISSYGDIIDATSYADGALSITHTESVAGTKTKNCSITTEYDTATSSWSITTPDSIAASTIPVRFNQEVITGNLTAEDLQVNGQANFDLPPHSVTPILGNDLATKGYVDTLVGNYGGNGLALYFNIPSANPNPIVSYPLTGALQQTLVAVDATPSADFYTLRTTALGTDTKIATFTTPVGYPNTLTIPAGLWNMLIYGYSTGTGGNLFYHFHLSELKADTSVVLIATSGFSSDVNAVSSVDPDAYHANLSIVTPYTLDSLDSRLIIDIYTTGTGAVPTYLYTLFGGLYYSFTSTSLSGGTSLLTTDNNWTGSNYWNGGTYEFYTDVYAPTQPVNTGNNLVATCEFVYTALGDYANLTTANSFTELQTFETGIYTQYIEAPTPDGVVGLFQGQVAGGNITLGSALVETTIDGTLKATTPLTNTNNTVVATTGWVNTWFQTLTGMSAYLTTATASSTYQTLAGMSAYLTTATAASTYQTLAGMSAYLTTASAASTYQTLAGMSAYLTTASAASTYQTIVDMANYLTTAAASSTYQTLAGMSAYLTTATAASTYLSITNAASTYQTIVDMANYLTTAAASSTYQTLAGMSAYLTTATASSTYQTLAGMSAYLTTAAASSTYQTLAGMSAYGAKATTNTWDLLQTFTAGVNTSSISFSTAATAASIYNTTTGIVNLATTSSEINIGNFRFTANSINRGAPANDINIGDTQVGAGANLNLGTAATRAGPIAIGNNSCAVNVGGILNAQQGLVLSASKFITCPWGATPASTENGGVTVGSILGTGSACGSTNYRSVGQVTVPKGAWMIVGNTNLTGVGTCSKILIGFGDTAKTNDATGFAGAFTYAVTTLCPQASMATDVYPSCTSFVRNTTGGNITVYMTINLTYTGTQPVISATNWSLNILKVA